MNFEIIIDHISKTMNFKKWWKKFHRLQNIVRAYFGTKINWSSLFMSISKYFEYKIDHISKTKNLKNRKIVFSKVSEHYASFWTKNSIWQLSGGKMSACLKYVNSIIFMIMLTRSSERIFIPMRYTVFSEIYN